MPPKFNKTSSIGIGQPKGIPTRTMTPVRIAQTASMRIEKV